MLSKLDYGLRVALGVTLLSLNTLVHTPVLFVATLFRLILPFEAARNRMRRMLGAIAESWIGFNSWMVDTLTTTQIELEGELPDHPKGQYLVICNHQSWADIPILQKLFNRRLPLLRFFLKSQLIWVPLLGPAWWALDFPFMKRYSKEQIARKPQLTGRDIAATKKACEKFRTLPVALMNFVEGTRFEPDKHARQNSPYQHLLKPRSGGVAFVLETMGESIDTLLDVTIVYSLSRPSLADLFANRIRQIRVSLRTLEIPERFRRMNHSDDEQKQAFRTWINDLWREKDLTVGRLKAQISGEEWTPANWKSSLPRSDC
ncbi:MAG: acyltransferase [Pseudomonadota bacterium]